MTNLVPLNVYFQAPIAAAAVGGLAIGGPVGIAAGSVLAGVVAGVGGVIGGKFLNFRRIHF